jgi:hypothetical protein
MQMTIYNSCTLNVGLIVALLATGAEPAKAAEGGYSNVSDHSAQ